MNVKQVERKENSVVTIEIEVGQEEFEAAVERAYRKNRGKVNVPGFRKGKATRKVIEAMYGASFFYEDAVNELSSESYEEAVRQEKLETVGYPEMEIISIGKEGFSFSATVAVMPEAELGNYKGLSAFRPAAEATEEDIETELKPLIERASSLVTAERPAADGDTVIIDFEGFDNGVPFEGGKGENYNLVLGSNSFVPGFESQLVGLSAGDERELDITFPENYHENLAGKPVVFKVKVNEVKETVAPALDDEFAKDVSEFETLSALRESLAEKVRARKASDADEVFLSGLMEQIVTDMKADIPQALVEQQAERLLNDFVRQITSQGIRFEDYAKMTGMDYAAIREQSLAAALPQVRSELALSAVAKAEGLAPSGEEVAAEYERVAEQVGMPLERVRAVIPETELTHNLTMQKASKFVMEHAVPLAEKAERAETADAEKPKRRRASEKKEEGETPKRKSASSEEGGAAGAPAAKKKAAAKKTAAAKAGGEPEAQA